jgi:long-chain acyl-CoA synthetase
MRRLELTRRIRVAIQARVSANRDIPRETLDDEIGFEIERVLRRVWFVDELPKRPTGKILKRDIAIPVEA